MKILLKKYLAAWLLSILLFIPKFVFAVPDTNSSGYDFSAGMSKVDITGPPSGVMFFGYGREDQIGEGIHTRQFARSLVIRDKISGRMLAYVTAEVGAIPFEIQRDVLVRLQREVDPSFEFGNILLNASHTHSTPTGYFHYSLFNENFLPKYYKVICDGIFLSIKKAYYNLSPAKLLIGKSNVESGGINRSLVAYLTNPEMERNKYETNIDTTMVQIVVNTKKGNIGFINWYGVHPTNMTFNNHFISSDNKGVAAYLSERSEKMKGNADFVAIFAQANEGDVSPNLNLNNTGPGKDIFESSQIIGERQFIASQNILNGKELRALPGGITYRHSFVNMGSLKVRKEFADSGVEETTCSSAYGYAFAGGSTEEGGGHWLFREGMVDRDRKFYIDMLAAYLVKAPSEELRKCQYPKAVLLPMGETKPFTSLAQILPMGIVLIGDFGILVSPNEVTTMSSRRLKTSVSNILHEKIKDLVLSGLTNDFGGYITTREEYSTQQYEGGHTLFGPNSLNALQQEYVRLARDLKSNSPSTDLPAPRDLSGELKFKLIPDSTKMENNEGKIYRSNFEAYKKGETVLCVVSSVSPNIGYPNVSSYFDVEKKVGEQWIAVYHDFDLSTKFIYKKPSFPFYEGKAHLEWATDTNDESGNYRLSHISKYRDKSAIVKDYAISCPPFWLE